MAIPQLSASVFRDKPQTEAKPKANAPPFIVSNPERRASPAVGSAENAQRVSKPFPTTCQTKKSGIDEKPVQRKPSGREDIRGATLQSESNPSAVFGEWATNFSNSADALSTLQGLLPGQPDNYGFEDRRDYASSSNDGLDSVNGTFGQQEKKSFTSPWSDQGFASSADGMMNFEPLLDKLAPLLGDDGIFEVMLTGNETMAVVVNTQPALLSILLSSTDTKLTKFLQPQQMELGARLERRIGRNVKITVL